LLGTLGLQLLDALLRRVQRQPQAHGALHQQISRISLQGHGLTDQGIGYGILGVGAGLAQSGQKLLKLVTFCGVHGESPSWLADGLKQAIMGLH
jgi:hypothetical protein